MSIKFLARDSEFGKDINFVPLLRNGSVHYISVAMPGLTMASTNIERAGSFSVDERNQFMMTVNRAKETGTLYPRVNITLLPSPRGSYLGIDSTIYHDGDYSEKEVIVHIGDAFKANSQYVKSEKMYFDFRNLCVSEDHYITCLKKTISGLKDKDVSEVITWCPPKH